MAAEKGRRKFLIQSFKALAGLPLAGSILNACVPETKKVIPGKLKGPDFKAGHLLRKALSVVPTQTETKDVVIIGGGISGLSAACWLKQNSDQDFCLLELEEETGGNSRGGKNAHTVFPWGAHYLPLPNNDLTELLAFLQENEVITGFNAAGLPIYRDECLCFDPEERLYINGHWQEGLVPNWGVPEADLKQINRFLELMAEMKQAKGTDGKFAFTIPISASSADENFRRLDKLTMAEWLIQNKLTSDYLHWYVNYCCRDDFGTDAKDTSAWAGIHYFAGRKAQAANTDPDRVLTWPEGNNWLAQRLRKPLEKHIRTGKLVYKVSLVKGNVAIDYLDIAQNTYHRILAGKCILATPQFVNERILNIQPEQGGNRNYKAFSYAPWAVANLALESPPAGRGVPLSWDNVVYGSKSLGYVLANHQQLQIYPENPVITFYLPLPDEDPAKARRMAYEKKQEDWAELILAELEKAHPFIRENVKNLDVWIWGHGMIRPSVGFIWGEEKAAAEKPVLDKIFFAHTDLSGISIFEEAFYQGIRAAQRMVEGKA
ncbi:NAD(P)-binding protein [Adhaeribacter soli]|uniref:NAD(P)-binding protein n=1 Tax=Adhaeribacter soli TaxID=2607655 RepID=A0A5N1J436_9BACT|nr:NAD(P)/FAD-dependent oxidoreductase [Adhaeribacter soli]KAA9345666.1 NAD(P)-binding protein [Adhaeribacter soli]